jgi:hypothetical protein
MKTEESDIDGSTNEDSFCLSEKYERSFFFRRQISSSFLFHPLSSHFASEKRENLTSFFDSIFFHRRTEQYNAKK